MQYEDLFDIVGHFGSYQILLYVLLGLPSVFPGYQNVAMNFLGAAQEHWCEISRLANFSHKQQKYFSIPKDDKGKYKSCWMYNLNYSKYTDEDFMNWNRSLVENAVEVKCKSWVFDKSEFLSTVTADVSIRY